MEWQSLLMPVGGVLWSLAYIFLIRLGIKNKTFTMPMIPLFFNTSWEFMYSVIFPSTFLPARLFNFCWFLLDLALITLLFKYSKYSSFFIILVFGLIFGTSYLTHIGIQLLIDQNILNNPRPSVYTGFIFAIIISLGLIFKLKSNLVGHSKLCAWIMLLGTVFFVLEILLNPSHVKYFDYILIVLMVMSIIGFCSYLNKLYKTTNDYI